ncbi:FDLD family class I lanthipeptide [Corynebacterium sp.]|uniref:FDLD family class I lanthipeptide n=1 Tax=Corynebacterium sp. TaxID=1720 RepID=UPI0034620027
MSDFDLDLRVILIGAGAEPASVTPTRTLRTRVTCKATCSPTCKASCGCTWGLDCASQSPLTYRS